MSLCSAIGPQCFDISGMSFEWFNALCLVILFALTLFAIYSFGFSTAINAYRGFGYTCTGNEGFISNCTASPFTCITDDADHAIAIECGM